MIENKLRAVAGALAVAGSLASTAHAQTTTLYPRWSHQSGSENWVAREVSLGNEGTEVFSQLDVSGLSRRLFTEGSSLQASPVWQSTDGQSTFYQRVASCESRSLHASARDEVVATGHVLQVRLYASNSSQAQWLFTSPATTNPYSNFGLHFATSGERLVLHNYAVGQNRTDVRVFSPTSAVPIAVYNIDTRGAVTGSRLSADGSTLLLESNLAATLVDLNTGQLKYQFLIFGSATQAVGMDAAATRFAFGMSGAARVFRSNAQGTWSLAFDVAVGIGVTVDAIAISGDGSRLAISRPSAFGSGDVVIDCYDLTASLQAGASTLIWSYAVPTTGALFNRASELQFSSDGQTLVAGLWGDDGGPSPEMLVFRNDQGTPAHRADFQGSVQRVCLSPDGRHLLVASKARHNTVLATDGSIDYFELGAPDLTVSGVPHAGGNVTLRATSQPGRSMRLLSGSARNAQPLPLGSMGPLHLNRMQLLSLSPSASADAQGVAEFTYPLSSATVGTSVYFQTLQLNPRELGHDWCKVTVVP